MLYVQGFLFISNVFSNLFTKGLNSNSNVYILNRLRCWRARFNVTCAALPQTVVCVRKHNGFLPVVLRAPLWDWGHDYSDCAAKSGLIIRINLTDWFRLIFTVNTSGVLRMFSHSRSRAFSVLFCLLTVSPICCIIAQANSCLFWTRLVPFPLSLWNKYGSCSLKDHLVTHDIVSFIFQQTSDHVKCLTVSRSHFDCKRCVCMRVKSLKQVALTDCGQSIKDSLEFYWFSEISKTVPSDKGFCLTNN